MDANRGRIAGRRSGDALTRCRKLAAASAGQKAESDARRYLTARGLEFLAANYRCRYGELDLVMRDGACLVFVEVRARRSASAGAPEASLSARKWRCLTRAARCFISDHPKFGGMMLRFDVVGILTHGPHAGIRWIRNALQFDGR
ncbi:YraN family protein [Candidatus Foliamicus sp.]